MEDHNNPVQTAKEFYNFCKAILSEVRRDKLERRVFFYVPSNDILRDRNREGTAVAVKNSQSVHSIRSTRNAGEVEAKFPVVLLRWLHQGSKHLKGTNVSLN